MQERVCYKDGQLKIIGDCTIYTLPDIQKQAAPYLSKLDALTVDLSAIDRYDSSCLVLLLLLQKHAEKNGIAFSCESNPGGLSKIAKIYNLRNILPLSY